MVNLPLSLGQFCLGLVSILAFMSSSIKLFGQAFTAITVHKETTSTLFNLICALTLCFGKDYLRKSYTHITYYYLMFFIAYAFKGQAHVFAGRVKIVSYSSTRTSIILQSFVP